MPSQISGLPELPPVLAPLGPGTTHKLLPDECDCGLGPHDWSVDGRETPSEPR